MNKTACLPFGLLLAAPALALQGGPATLWTSDDTTNTIYHTTLDGTVITSWNSGSVSGLAVDPTDDTLWAAKEGFDRIVHFDRMGSELGFIPVTDFDPNASAPEGVGVDFSDDTLWVVDDVTNIVYNIQKSGSLIASFPTSSYDPASTSPQAIATDPGGSLWLTDNATDRVYNVSESGAQISSFPTSMFGGGTNNPQGISVDELDGTLWITDRTMHMVYNVQRNGTLLSAFDSLTYGSANPTGVAFDKPVSGNTFSTYFGEDQGMGSSTPLPSFPNAIAARDNFLMMAAPVELEDFENLVTGASSPLPLDFDTQGDGILQGFGRVKRTLPGETDEYGAYAVSGEQYWLTCDGFTVVFDQPHGAFGFCGVDVGDQGGRLELRVNFLDGSHADFDVPHELYGEEGNVIFFGVVTDKRFQSVEFTFPEVDFTGFDNFYVGDPAHGLGTPYCSNVANSTGSAGEMFIFGSTAVADNDVTLVASSLPAGGSAYFLISGGGGMAAIPASNGLICLLGGDPSLIGRYTNLVFVADDEGMGSAHIDLTMTPRASGGGPYALQPGDTRFFQCWYRDSAGSPTTNNFTNAVAVTFQ